MVRMACATANHWLLIKNPPLDHLCLSMALRRLMRPLTAWRVRPQTPCHMLALWLALRDPIQSHCAHMPHTPANHIPCHTHQPITSHSCHTQQPTTSHTCHAYTAANHIIHIPHTSSNHIAHMLHTTANHVTHTCDTHLPIILYAYYTC